MTEPKITPDFTIEDIHKIRAYHYGLTKQMPFDQQREFYHEGTLALKELLDQRKIATGGKAQGSARIAQ